MRVPPFMPLMLAALFLAGTSTAPEHQRFVCEKRDALAVEYADIQRESIEAMGRIIAAKIRADGSTPRARAKYRTLWDRYRLLLAHCPLYDTERFMRSPPRL